MSDISKLASQIVASAAGQQIIALAESCTGGMVAAAITDIAGSSAVLDRGFVTYSNEAKMETIIKANREMGSPKMTALFLMFL